MTKPCLAVDEPIITAPHNSFPRCWPWNGTHRPSRYRRHGHRVIRSLSGQSETHGDVEHSLIMVGIVEEFHDVALVAGRMKLRAQALGSDAVRFFVRPDVSASA